MTWTVQENDRVVSNDSLVSLVSCDRTTPTEVDRNIVDAMTDAMSKRTPSVVSPLSSSSVTGGCHDIKNDISHNNFTRLSSQRQQPLSPNDGSILSSTFTHSLQPARHPTNTSLGSNNGGDSHPSIDDILRKVVDDGEDELFPPVNPVSGSSNGGRVIYSRPIIDSDGPLQSGGNDGNNAYTHSQVFMSPSALTPTDTATPVKDPLDSFNTWMKGQTPTGHIGAGGRSVRNSPTSGSSTYGRGMMVSAGASTAQGDGMTINTPLNGGGRIPKRSAMMGSGELLIVDSPTAPSSGIRTAEGGLRVGNEECGGSGRNRDIGSIVEKRRALMQQVEELNIVEMELRRDPQTVTPHQGQRGNVAVGSGGSVGYSSSGGSGGGPIHGATVGGGGNHYSNSSSSSQHQYLSGNPNNPLRFSGEGTVGGVSNGGRGPSPLSYQHRHHLSPRNGEDGHYSQHNNHHRMGGSGGYGGQGAPTAGGGVIGISGGNGTGEDHFTASGSDNYWAGGGGNSGLNPYAASFGSGGGNSQHQHPMTPESVRGRVYETAKDQHGCRFLQRALDSNSESEVSQIIMKEIVPYVPELMTDQYANFLVQKLFDIMPHDVRFNVAKVVAPQMPLISFTAHGTFSVQKLIETITTREEMVVVRDAITHDVVRLVMDVHGNHVIQKVLQRFDHPDKQFIYDAVSKDCANIAVNKQGCCVLQRCLEYASPPQHAALVATILTSALRIIQDPYGNYVLQYVLESDDIAINDRIGLVFLPHLVVLGVNKFSSNVMERVLRRTSQSVKDKYCEALCDENVTPRLLSDDFGNYVVQTALTTGSQPVVEGLIQTIRPLLPMIRNAPYAKKLEAKIDMIAKKGPGGLSGGGMNVSKYGGGHSHHHHGSGVIPRMGGGGNPFRGGPPMMNPSGATNINNHHHVDPQGVSPGGDYAGYSPYAGRQGPPMGNSPIIPGGKGHGHQQHNNNNQHGGGGYSKMASNDHQQYSNSSHQHYSSGGGGQNSQPYTQPRGGGRYTAPSSN